METKQFFILIFNLKRDSNRLEIESDLREISCAFWELYRSRCCTFSLGELICTSLYLNIEANRHQIPFFGCHGMSRNVFTPYSSLPLSRSIRLSLLLHSLSPLFALAEINRRYLTLMWEHNVSCSVETTFVSATGLFALGNCAPLSCKAAWRYSCCKEGSKVSGRGGNSCDVEI